MPKSACSLQFTVNSNKRSVNRQPSTVNRKANGFTLIELLVAISISSIVVGLITASYVSFSNSQKLKSAVASLKSDLRYTQNNSTASDKGLNHNCSTNIVDQTSLPLLVGWYLHIDKNSPNNSAYYIKGDCLTKGVLQDTNSALWFDQKTVNLPSGVTISNFTCPSMSAATQANILFRPLNQSPSFHAGDAIYTPPFLKADGTFGNALLGCTGDFTITLSLSAPLGGAASDVVISTSGEIHDE